MAAKFWLSRFWRREESEPTATCGKCGRRWVAEDVQEGVCQECRRKEGPMSDSGRVLGECRHGRERERCPDCAAPQRGAKKEEPVRLELVLCSKCKRNPVFSDCLPAKCQDCRAAEARPANGCPHGNTGPEWCFVCLKETVGRLQRERAKTAEDLDSARGEIVRLCGEVLRLQRGQFTAEEANAIMRDTYNDDGHPFNTTLRALGWVRAKDVPPNEADELRGKLAQAEAERNKLIAKHATDFTAAVTTASHAKQEALHERNQADILRQDVARLEGVAAKGLAEVAALEEKARKAEDYWRGVVAATEQKVQHHRDRADHLRKQMMDMVGEREVLKEQLQGARLEARQQKYRADKMEQKGTAATPTATERIDKALDAIAARLERMAHPPIIVNPPEPHPAPGHAGDIRVPPSPEDVAKLAEQFERYTSGIQRYVTLVGGTEAKPLDPANVEVLHPPGKEPREKVTVDAHLEAPVGAAVDNTPGLKPGTMLFTREQLLAAKKIAREEEREGCARLCDRAEKDARDATQDATTWIDRSIAGHGVLMAQMLGRQIRERK